MATATNMSSPMMRRKNSGSLAHVLAARGLLLGLSFGLPVGLPVGFVVGHGCCVSVGNDGSLKRN